MKTTNNTPANIYTEFGPLGYLFRWIDEHPRTSSALLWLMSAALVWVVFTYDFTTRI